MLELQNILIRDWDKITATIDSLSDEQFNELSTIFTRWEMGEATKKAVVHICEKYDLTFQQVEAYMAYIN